MITYMKYGGFTSQVYLEMKIFIKIKMFPFK